VEERIQAAVLAKAREHSWPIALSIGVANYAMPAASITDMMSAADQLMYRAKQSGKNRIIHESIESSL
jgi:diguanylate cyclase (GGDEF)-like protein